MKHFGERLRRARQAKGLTQEQVATYLMIDRTTYNKYEAGRADPHLETLWMLAQLLEVTTDSLLCPEK